MRTGELRLFGNTAGSGSSGGSEAKSVELPKNNAQLKHIFRNKEGHLPDTPENRELLRELANDKSKFMGVDKNGISWNVRENPDGTQDWVEYKDGIIREGGRNLTPRMWNPDTGLNHNPNSTPNVTPNTNPSSILYDNPFITEKGDIS